MDAKQSHAHPLPHLARPGSLCNPACLVPTLCVGTSLLPLRSAAAAEPSRAQLRRPSSATRPLRIRDQVRFCLRSFEPLGTSRLLDLTRRTVSMTTADLLRCAVGRAVVRRADHIAPIGRLAVVKLDLPSRSGTIPNTMFLSVNVTAPPATARALPMILTVAVNVTG